MTLYGPSAASPTATVPVIAPVDGLTFSPSGRPDAVKLSVPPLVSLWPIDRETVPPSVLVWAPGSVIETGLPTFQVNVTSAEYVPSPAVMVTS